MSNANEFYLKEIFDKSLKYRATWEPNKSIKVGDVGVLENGVFSKRFHLSTFGIKFEVEINKKDKGEEGEEIKRPSLDFSSESGIEIHTKLKGKVDPKVPMLGELDTGFVIEFKKGNTIFFQIHDYFSHEIANLGTVGGHILDLYERGDWEKDYVLINEVIEADKATIMISGEAGLSVGVKAKAKAGVGEAFSLADAELDAGFESGGKLATKIVGRKGITPLYRAVGVKKKIFLDLFEYGEANFGTRSKTGGGAEQAGKEKLSFDDIFEDA